MKINSLISRFETPPSPPEGKAEKFVVDGDGSVTADTEAGSVTLVDADTGAVEPTIPAAICLA